MPPTTDVPQRSDGGSPAPYYDDFDPRERYSHDESYTLAADEFVEFAETCDPQPFHADETVAREL